MIRGSTRALVLFGLTFADCGERDKAIPPALASLHQRAVSGDAAAQLDLGLRYVRLPREAAAQNRVETYA